ncbi:Export control protein Chs7 [Neofusicoccum parvum]|uniref:Export control protein Chs7 n=2 Tax=Neofusicoccum parvum TaxID=310453 RepID=A0ACB5S517_9PEZI|nr:putative export control protein chs7- protein [Neofusicoccum parvum UCRNP2]GME27857.1 Export control protein Chs7 [Neofusicoccum parvum]GME61097.1 Export control protein Chs7 [Neofusicoccum parvum]
MSQYGNFYDFCRDSGSAAATIPVCNLFSPSPAKGGSGYDGGCDLTGISLSNGRHLANLGSILFCGIAIVASAFLLWRSERKKAAVGRREMQLFLAGYIVISICEIFTVGGFPLDGAVRRGFSAVHIAAVVASIWILLLNGAVGFQLLDDGTPLSLGLIVASSVILFVGTGYIALDTTFQWTGYWDDTLADAKSYSLYTLYQLIPLVFLFIFFVLEAYLVVRVLGEKKPMIYLAAAALLFAIGQIFQYVISVHLCNATNGKINGGLFETFFTLCAVVMIWVFWSSITEDDWPMPVTGGAYT